MARLRFNIEGFGGGVLTVKADSVRVDAAGLSALRKLVLSNTISLAEICAQYDLPRVLGKYAARTSLRHPVVEAADIFECLYDRAAIEKWCAAREF